MAYPEKSTVTSVGAKRRPGFARVRFAPILEEVGVPTSKAQTGAIGELAAKPHEEARDTATPKPISQAKTFGKFGSPFGQRQRAASAAQSNGEAPIAMAIAPTTAPTTPANPLPSSVSAVPLEAGDKLVATSDSATIGDLRRTLAAIAAGTGAHTASAATAINMLSGILALADNVIGGSSFPAAAHHPVPTASPKT